MLAGIQQRIRFRAEPGGKRGNKYKKKIGLLGCIGTGIGAIIGSGISVHCPQ